MSVKDILPWKSHKTTSPAGTARGFDDPFLSLHRRMNSLFDDFFDGAPAPWGEAEGFFPSVDVAEKEGEFVVRAELPGVEEKDLEVTVEEKALTIRGEKKEEHEEERENLFRMERSFGSFHRQIRLSAPLDREKVKASFKKGVLKIHLPKAREALASSRRIKIES